MKKTFLIFLLLFTTNIFSNFIEKHDEGWSWYSEKKPVKNNSKKKIIADPIKTLNQSKKALKRALSLAILDPTTLNIQHYIQLQNAFSERASLFANKWQEVLWRNPSLDFSTLYPTSSEGRFIFSDELQQKKMNAVKQLAKKYGLFFFFRGDCPYCHHFAPILKHFSDTYHLRVIPVSLDGKGLPEYPAPKHDRGQAEKLKVQSVPTVFAVAPHFQHVIPIASGVVSEDILLDRIYRLTRDVS